MGLDNLGREVMGQRVGGGRTVLACKVVGEDRWCQQCGGKGVVRDTVIRRLAHVPYGWRPTMLHVSVCRYRCQTCAHVWRQNMCAAADPRAKLSRAAVRWALVGLVVHHLTVARIADVVSWNTANTAILGEGQHILIDDHDRFEGWASLALMNTCGATPPTATRIVTVDSHTRSSRPLPAPGYGPRALQKGLPDLVGLPASHLAREHRGRCDGWIHRVQKRRR